MFFTIFRSTFREYKRLSLIILNNEYLCTAYGQGNEKIFCKNFDDAETVIIEPSESFPVYGIYKDSVTLLSAYTW